MFIASKCPACSIWRKRMYSGLHQGTRCLSLSQSRTVRSSRRSAHHISQGKVHDEVRKPGGVAVSQIGNLICYF
ncbi:hypothetical protein [Janthinobacterium sp. 1_2014MBL_MicDiv]|uniref:hypothetical protein n=1 Tax=Janthinobacterium sp. 1_2014MBL_MicDiv TaxID=1644131 RepID=UPI0008F52B67|nr:hypothetical protein [Janthinobacterium sp. 1_2014MBL_MicDiv]APA68465.1 hypothetical protein YQ44_12250 [Janthinobacterium sp. 1_2014MBL_MicDiv]